MIVVGHGIRINPLILKVVHPDLKIVFLPDIAGIFSPLQLGAMFEFHACYQTLVIHNFLEQHAPMLTALRIDNIIALLHSLHAWRTVMPTAIVSEIVSSGLVPQSAFEATGVSGFILLS